MRLIDADALRAEFKTPTDWLDSKQVFTHVTGIWATIDLAPTVEPEQKTGKWMLADTYAGKRYRCSECLAFALKTDDGKENLSDYCPVCGAEMKGEDDGTD